MFTRDSYMYGKLMDASVHRVVRHGIMCVHLMKRNLSIVKRSTEPNREKSVKVTKPAASKLVLTVKLRMI